MGQIDEFFVDIRIAEEVWIRLSIEDHYKLDRQISIQPVLNQYLLMWN